MVHLGKFDLDYRNATNGNVGGYTFKELSSSILQSLSVSLSVCNGINNT